MTTEHNDGALPGEQKTPDEQRAILTRLALKFENEERGQEQAEAVEGEYLAGAANGDADEGRREEMDFEPFITGVFSFVFDVAAERAGEHWRLTDREAKEIGSKGAAAVEDIAGKIHVTPAWALAGTAALVMAPRIMAQRKISKQRAKEQQPDDKDTDAPPAHEQDAD